MFETNMISFLSGRPQINNDRLIIITSAGIGFQVFVNPTLLSLATTEEKLDLLTHSYIREDRFELYGFTNPADLALFELLITVSGLGPKTALGMFGREGSARIIQAIQQAELSFFTSVPRVGKKVGQKIIIDLKTKLGGLKDIDLTPKSQTYQDVKESLLALGYNETDIERTLPQLDWENLETASALKAAIKLIAQK